MEFSFLLNNNPVPEPLGWDQVKFTLKRSDTYNGLSFEFTDEFTWDKDAAGYLRAAYEAGGIDAEVSITIRFLDCTEPVEDFTGMINFALYKTSADGVTVGIRPSSFSETFKNRMDIPVNLSAGRNLDGGTLPDIMAHTVSLHSKEISFQSRWKINTALKNFTLPLIAAIWVPPFEILSEELDQALQPGYYTPPDDHPVFYSGFTYPPGITQRTITLDGRLLFTGQFDASGSGVKFVVRLLVKKVTGGQVLLDEFLYEQPVPNKLENTYDVQFFRTVAVPPDTNIFIQCAVTAPFLVGQQTISFNDQVSYLRLSENSIYPPSTARAYLVHEIFSRITEAITGVPDSFRSDYFGRVDSLPHAYGQDGAGSLLAITNGLNIRNMLDGQKPPEPFPVVASFGQIFEGLDPIHNLAMSFETMDGKEYVRVEPKEYFYRTEIARTFSFISELEQAPDLSQLYNEAEFGYQKWETEEVNGIDEFNTKRSYASGIRNNKRKLSKVSSLIAGGYLLELTRRQQYKSTPTTDYRTDHDLFCICVIREYDPHDPEKFSYVAERVAGLEPVERLFSPFTAYNIRISPARNARRWSNILAASVVKEPVKAFQFVSGTGNYRMSATGIAEDSDIPLNITPLYLPETVSFEYPLSFPEFLQLKGQINQSIAYSCNDYGHGRGFVREVTYSPGNGIAQFRLIRTSQ